MAAATKPTWMGQPRRAIGQASIQTWPNVARGLWEVRTNRRRFNGLDGSRCVDAPGTLFSWQDRGIAVRSNNPRATLSRSRRGPGRCISSLVTEESRAGEALPLEAFIERVRAGDAQAFE